MINYTWIKLHRKLLENPIMKNAELLQLFIYCLLRANHKKTEIIFNKVQIILKKGQFITGRFELAKALNQKPKTVYNRLQILKNLGYLDIETNNRFTTISVVNYSTYQSMEITKGQQNGQHEDNRWTTDGQQMDTDKNDKNDKNDKKREYTIPPEFDWIIERCGVMNYPAIETEAEKFFNYYQSNGWKVGKNPMKDWQAALSNWFKNYKNYNNYGKGTPETKSDRLARASESINQLIQRVTAK